MHTGITVVGVILLVTGIMVAIVGIDMMNQATTETLFGTYGDQGDYDNGAYLMIGGGVIGFIGFLLMLAGLASRPEQKQPYYPPQPQYQQPAYPYQQQPPVPYQQPYYQQPAAQPAPQPVHQPIQQPVQQVTPQPVQQIATQPVQQQVAKQVTPVQCPDCGYKNPATAKFCNECGEPF